MSLELLGMTPGVGMVADAANAGISLFRGNYADALINLAAMVPLIGQGVTGGKLAAKAASSATDVLTKTTGKMVDDVAGLGKATTNSYTKNHGRAGKQARLRELASDPKLGKADKGWIKQEQNAIARGKRKSIRNPPGKDLAHERGREALKGYGYEYSNLQERKLHRLQHKYDNFGRKNKERQP